MTSMMVAPSPCRAQKSLVKQGGLGTERFLTCSLGCCLLLKCNTLQSFMHICVSSSPRHSEAAPAKGGCLDNLHLVVSNKASTRATCKRKLVNYAGHHGLTLRPNGCMRASALV